MARKMTVVWLAVLGVALLASRAGAEETAVLKTQKEKVSYGIGVDLAKSFRSQGIEVDLDLLVRGLKDGLSGGKLLIPESDLRKVLAEFRAELMQKRAQEMKLAAEENRKKGEAFLAENGTREGVMTMPSGLQYKILKLGNGRTPTEADTVEVSYRGTHINGTDFNSTEAGKPATLKLKSGLIPGWTEALQLMPVGSRFRVFIPPQLGYGEKGAGADIGPNETLIFEVELLAIK
jgi:FKBP-type peptidyl-prolyl cis-trans isomerase FklB